MLEFLQQALAFVLAVASVVSAPLSALGVKNTQQMAAVGSAYQQEILQPVMSGLYSHMSPSVLSISGQRQMWLSGKAAKNTNDGLIYTSFYNQQGFWVEPVAAFSVAGSYVADPSVIVDPTGDSSYRMYYSSISKTDAASSTLVRLKNHIGQAHSNDGVEWVDDGIILGQNNGFDERGGWSPSALIVGDEVWLYYSTNYPDKIQVYRTRFNSAGKKLDTQPVVVADQNSQKTLEGFNVDVHLSRHIGKYVMLLNKDFTGIIRYVSDDGLLWTTLEDDKKPIVQAASSSLVAAPTVEVVTQPDGIEQYNLFFVGGPISKGLFEGVYYLADVSGLGTSLTFVDPGAKDYETWTSAGTDSSSGSGSGSNGGGAGGLLALGAVGVLGIAALVGFNFLTTAAPVAATASGVATGGSFGGRIIAIMPCVSALGPSVWVTLKPSGLLLPPFMYIWTPATLTNIVPPSPSLPPRNIGQQLLGRFDIPFACVVPFPPFVFYGLRMQIMGASPVL